MGTFLSMDKLHSTLIALSEENPPVTSGANSSDKGPLIWSCDILLLLFLKSWGTERPIARDLRHHGGHRKSL